METAGKALCEPYRELAVHQENVEVAVIVLVGICVLDLKFVGVGDIGIHLSVH